MTSVPESRYGRLTVLGRAPCLGKKKAAHWWCKCDCGKVVNVAYANLRKRRTQSCGCFRLERLREAITIHGKSEHRMYRVFQGMIQRCHNQKDCNYPKYGARGIMVCERWREEGGFSNFLADMGIPDPGMSIERVDNNGDYEPSNCKWIPRGLQNRNKRTTIWIEYNTEVICLADLAERVGIPYELLYGRYTAGHRGENLIKPLRN